MLLAIIVPIALLITCGILVGEANQPGVYVGLMAVLSVIIALEARSLVPRGLGRPFNLPTIAVVLMLIASSILVIPLAILVGLYYYKRSVVLRGGTPSPAPQAASPRPASSVRQMPASAPVKPAATPAPPVRQMPAAAPAPAPRPMPAPAPAAKPPSASNSVLGDE
jgi:hypothetical protein